MIPNLVEVLEKVGLDRGFLAIGFAAILTAVALITPLAVRSKRNSSER